MKMKDDKWIAFYVRVKKLYQAVTKKLLENLTFNKGSHMSSSLNTINLKWEGLGLYIAL